MTMPGVDADSPSPVPDPGRILHQESIEEAVGPRGHGADAAELLEHRLLLDDLPLISRRRSCGPASAATNRLVFQPGTAVGKSAVGGRKDISKPTADRRPPIADS